MSSINQQLQAIGLTKTESELYVLGHKLGGTATVAELQKHTSIKRPTIYHALQSLSDKGLLAKASGDGRTTFTFGAPRQLQSYAKRRLKQARDVLESTQLLIPLLEASQGTVATQTKVSHYEGEEGVRAVIENALYCRSGQWDILAPKDNYLSQTDKDYADYFLRTRKQKSIKARSLWEQGFRKDKPVNQELLKQRNPRLLPSEMKGNFSSLMIIYDNKIALISSQKELSAVLLESVEFQQMFKAMFETLWSISKPL